MNSDIQSMMGVLVLKFSLSLELRPKLISNISDISLGSSKLYQVLNLIDQQRYNPKDITQKI